MLPLNAIRISSYFELRLFLNYVPASTVNWERQTFVYEGEVSTARVISKVAWQLLYHESIGVLGPEQYPWCGEVSVEKPIARASSIYFLKPSIQVRSPCTYRIFQRNITGVLVPSNASIKAGTVREIQHARSVLGQQNW
jgi:hypothetical protein